MPDNRAIKHVDVRDVSSLPHGGTVALRKVSFTATSDAITGLIGDGRQGQHEALRILAGLADVRNGTVLVNGRPIQAVPPAARGVRIIFPNHAHDPRLTVSGLLLGAGDPDAVRGVLADVRMTEKAAARIGALSPADRFMVEVARQLVFLPDVLLFEDALIMYASAVRDALVGRLRDLNWRTPALLLVSGSDEPLLKRLCDTRIRFESGQRVS